MKSVQAGAKIQMVVKTKVEKTEKNETAEKPDISALSEHYFSELETAIGTKSKGDPFYR